MEKGDFKYLIHPDFDYVVDEKGSTFIALRKIAWGVDQNDDIDEDKYKLDLRKYYTTSDGERMNKGVSFLTEDGPHELTFALLKEGYGSTEKCLEILKERQDFKEAVNIIYNGKSDDDETLYDPRELLGA